MRIKEQGDTLIEVVMAFAIFGMLAIGALALMNSGTRSARQALEMTMTQQAVAGQAETLRFLRESYLANPVALGPSRVFKELIANTTYVNPSKTATSNYNNDTCVDSVPSGAFALNPADNASDISVISAKPINDVNAPAYPQLASVGGVTTAYGVWIEAVRGTVPAGQPTFIDFHIRACWYSAKGKSISKTGTIVRLYLATLP